MTPEKRIRLYRTKSGYAIEVDGRFYDGAEPTWDALIAREDLGEYLAGLVRKTGSGGRTHLDDSEILAPIGSQEVWAAGVTYFRSRDARMEESKSAGGGDFYDRVYSADRPELFFKATASRVVGHRGEVAIRKDAKWSVPEPELVSAGQSGGQDIGIRDRQRYELARHRGRESVVPAAGEGLSPELRFGPRHPSCG